MTSSSGGSIEHLRQPNRIVITATKTGTEKNATVLRPLLGGSAARSGGGHRQERIRSRALEAFRYAQTQDHRVLRYAEAPGHRALGARRHGQGKGERTATAENGEGKLAAAFPWCASAPTPPPRAIPTSGPLLEKKEQLEQAIDKLKYRQGRDAGRGLQDSS